MSKFWDTALLEPLTEVGTRIVHFLPNLLAAFVILGIGWPLAWGLGRGVERGLRILGVDHLADRIGLNAVLTRGGLKPDPCHLAGRMLYWGLLVVTVIASLNALDVAPINQFATTFLGYIPHLITAGVILVAGVFLTEQFCGPRDVDRGRQRLFPSRHNCGHSCPMGRPLGGSRHGAGATWDRQEHRRGGFWNHAGWRCVGRRDRLRAGRQGFVQRLP